jgi:hypothetical protein
LYDFLAFVALMRLSGKSLNDSKEAHDFNPLDKKTAAPTSAMKTNNRFQVCY